MLTVYQGVVSFSSRFLISPSTLPLYAFETPLLHTWLCVGPNIYLWSGIRVFSGGPRKGPLDHPISLPPQSTTFYNPLHKLCPHLKEIRFDFALATLARGLVQCFATLTAEMSFYALVLMVTLALGLKQAFLSPLFPSPTFLVLQNRIHLRLGDKTTPRISDIF